VSLVTKKKWRCIKLETKQNRYHVFAVVVIAVMLGVSFVCTASVYNLNEQVSSLQSEVAILQSAAKTAADTQDNSITTVSNTESVSLSDLYEHVENSVVTIQCTIVEYTMPFGRQVTAEVQGSGFVYDYEGKMVIITNNHVVKDAASITVTFADGNTYDVKVLGADTSTDLAVLSTGAPASEYYPLEIVSSSTVRVGDYVVAIGSPYGLAGTMTTGIVSALDRTITIAEDVGSSYDITGLIQTSAPINSGNSGGPLMTYDGQVIGITTAIVSNSDGLGFAVPSDTILTVIETLLA
jgi:S1-C subfamily serine protease